MTAEFVGSALLMSVIVGSGIVAATDGPASAQLFQHTIVVGLGLAVLIATLGSVSGAHFNPAVTAVDWWFGGMRGGLAARYVAMQVGGALVGTALTHLSFGLPLFEASEQLRPGAGLAGGEAVATGGLILVIFGLARSHRGATVPAAVGAWIAGAIYFTSSASFANPAVTLARAATDTFTGIAPASVPMYLAGQAGGVVAAAALVRYLYAPTPAEAADIVVPHPADGKEPSP